MMNYNNFQSCSHNEVIKLFVNYIKIYKITKPDSSIFITVIPYRTKIIYLQYFYK